MNGIMNGIIHGMASFMEWRHPGKKRWPAVRSVLSIRLLTENLGRGQ